MTSTTSSRQTTKYCTEVEQAAKNEFPLLHHLSSCDNDEAEFDKIEPANNDQLCMEANAAIQGMVRHLEDDSSSDHQRRRMYSKLFNAFCALDTHLVIISKKSTDRNSSNNNNNNNNKNKGSQLLLLRNTMLTPTNLSAFLSIAESESGPIDVQKQAVGHLCSLSAMESTWRVRLLDGSTFSYALIRVFSSFLERASFIPWEFEYQIMVVRFSLLRMLNVTKDKPEHIVDAIASLDWNDILNPSENEESPRDSLGMPICMRIFVALHDLTFDSLRKNEHDSLAKEFLGELGRCHNLFLMVLQSISEGALWPSGDSLDNQCHTMGETVQYLSQMLNCLSHLPTDSRTNDLMKSALKYLTRKLNKLRSRLAKSMQPSLGLDFVERIVLEIKDNWRKWQNETVDQKWSRIERFIHQVDPQVYKDDRREQRQKWKARWKQGMAKWAVDFPEMCGNCYKSEEDIGRQLRGCSRCNRVKYCSRECQVQHWKRAHKALCQKPHRAQEKSEQEEQM